MRQITGKKDQFTVYCEILCHSVTEKILKMHFKFLDMFIIANVFTYLPTVLHPAGHVPISKFVTQSKKL